ncbi:hypothetical protein [Actinoplanes sp. NPDC051494]|uniref:hypothetical protein n=1 Tax=Actinoplanes sp. NPDC051494 TaxID=3363907 RepID=UPI0037B1BCF4
MSGIEPAGAGLERDYRRLMWAFPGRFRARHGDDVVTTLMEATEPGRRRPAAADAWHLIGSGLRQRFRLPAGRPLAVVAAMLITLVMGAAGAAAGSWAGERTFTPVPRAGALLQLADGLERGDAARQDIGGSASPWTPPAVSAQQELTTVWSPTAAAGRFTADGWTVEPRGPERFEAVRDGVVVSVHGVPDDGFGYGFVALTAWARPGAALVPLTVAGMLLGMLGGWPAAAAFTYRATRRAAVPAGLALLAVSPAVVALYGNLLRMLTWQPGYGAAYTVHSALTPGPYYPAGPDWQVPACAVAGVLLTLTAMALTLTGPPAPARSQAA